jgi:hypothetical protein
MASSDIIWRVNRTPRFTVLELGEYMAADDGPRETILRNMRYERISRSLMYRLLYQTVASFLASPTRDRRILAKCRIELEEAAAAATNPTQRDNINYELRALDAFERSLNALEIGGINLERAPPRRLHIEGVIVSVRPTSHIRVERPRGAPLVGALMVDPAKGIEPKTDSAHAKMKDAMRYAAILLHQYATEVFDGDEGKVSPDHCIIFHVHRQDRIAAPSSYRRDYGNIRAVCRNIARSWAGVEPPTAFDKRFATYRS